MKHFLNAAKVAGDDKITINMNSSGMIQPKPITTFHEFYISGSIEEPENYIQWFDLIRHADDSDVIKLYINSYGGDLFTAIQFMRVLSETKATVIASVEGACMSAATMIFLCADQFEVTPHSVFMFHNYSGGTIGKGGEMIDQLQHERKWSQGLMNEIYKDFLSEEEIEHMLDNKDYWMDGNEVVKRLNARIESIVKFNESAKEVKKPVVKKKPAVKTPRKAPVKRPVKKNT
jgi:ATP-dependent protease ClpP protease subunit